MISYERVIEIIGQYRRGLGNSRSVQLYIYFWVCPTARNKLWGGNYPGEGYDIYIPLCLATSAEESEHGLFRVMIFIVCLIEGSQAAKVI